VAVELEQDAITSAAAKADNLRTSGQRIRADERYLSCVDNKLADVRLQGVHGDLGRGDPGSRCCAGYRRRRMGNALSLLALLMGLVLIPFGVWLLRNSRVPAWMTGIWKWPLGDNLTPTVARLQGWASVLVGAAGLVASVLRLMPYLPALFGAMVAAGLVGAGVFPLVWSVRLSRGKAA
jgi:hypothetical protein